MLLSPSTPSSPYMLWYISLAAYANIWYTKEQLYSSHLNTGDTSAIIHIYKSVCFHLSHFPFKSLAKGIYTPHCIYTSGFIRYICQPVVQMSTINTSGWIKYTDPFPTTVLSLNFVLPYWFYYRPTASCFLVNSGWKGNFSLFQNLLECDFHSQAPNFSEFEW